MSDAEPRSIPQLSHTRESGEARMVDVSAKAETLRTATASGSITMSRSAMTAIRNNSIAKGDVLSVARIAGIMAAKRTSELIPLCHPLALSHVDVTLEIDTELPGVRVEATATTTASTGVEMEAIVAVSIALATVYDMAKSADRAMVIADIRVLRKSGGRSGNYVAAQPDG